MVLSVINVPGAGVTQAFSIDDAGQVFGRYLINGNWDHIFKYDSRNATFTLTALPINSVYINFVGAGAKRSVCTLRTAPRPVFSMPTVN